MGGGSDPVHRQARATERPGAPEAVPDIVADVVEVVVTGPSAELLESLATGLVDGRLAACGQVIPAVASVYRWEGRVEHSSEARLALHTRATLADAVVQEVTERHPYAVPCVLVVPVVGANAAYRAWVVEQTT